MKSQTVLVTGAAGFIGFHTCLKLISKYKLVIGIDNLTNNYSIRYKKDNIKILLKYPNFRFKKIDILEFSALKKIFIKYKPCIVIHLAALTGVRNSISNPKLYEYVNVYGTKNVYELAIENHINKFIFASSSSIYGNKSKIPFKENNKLYPASPYAASKLKAEETIQRLHKSSKISTIILRFFSVYGPYGRPDMAPYIFTESAFSKKIVIKYGDGNSARDYTYVDDIVNAIFSSIDSKIVLGIFNIGNSHPIKLNQLIKLIEKYTHHRILLQNELAINQESKITYANIKHTKKSLKWKPKVSISIGLKKFIYWFKLNRI